MPEAVQSYFGDGQKWGVRLHYFIEEAPLGTAGSVRACAPFLEGEDFLVISGDSVCDLDLTAAMEFHQAKRAQATLVLFRHPAPLEYGLVLTDEEQRVVRFVEKPSWGQVVTDLVNTGIYLLSPQVLEQIPPDRPWDFGKDVFPALLESGGGLYGVPGGGYIGEFIMCSVFFPDQLAVAYPIAITIGNLVDPPATMINSAGDYVVSFLVSRFVDGKDWFQKVLASRNA